MKLNTKTAVFILAVSAVSLAGYIACVYALTILVDHHPAIGAFVFVDTHGSPAFSMKSAMIQPGAFMAVVLFCLAVEAFYLGVENSSLKRLVAGDTASAKVDLFYLALRLTGGINLLLFVFSFGLLFWTVNQVHRYLHIGALQYVHSNISQFAIVYLINTFVAYWGHRIMHTRWMWELHKVHHAAEEMNVVTPFRNHPIDQAINSLLNAFPVALLGARPSVVIVYYAVNMVYQSLVHSEISLKGRLWDKIWITPAAHRIHHSNREEHFDTNFGIVTFWDKVFGTYRLPNNEKLSYGVDDGALFNRPQFFRELFANARRWLRFDPVDKPSDALQHPTKLPPTTPVPMRRSA